MGDKAFEKSKELYVKLSNKVAEKLLPLSLDSLAILVGELCSFSMEQGSFETKKTKTAVSVSNKEGFYGSVCVAYQRLDLDTFIGELAMDCYKRNGGVKFSYAPFLVTSLQVSIAEDLNLRGA